MQIKSVLRKGEFHPVFCEDYLFHSSLNENLYLAAVMDGCTMGNDSHFASALFGKILKKIVMEIGYKEYLGELNSLSEYELERIGELILKSLWKELRELANKLFLEQLELLTTLILAIVNKESNQAWVIGTVPKSLDS